MSKDPELSFLPVPHSLPLAGPYYPIGSKLTMVSHFRHPPRLVEYCQSPGLSAFLILVLLIRMNSVLTTPGSHRPHFPLFLFGFVYVSVT